MAAPVGRSGTLVARSKSERWVQNVILWALVGAGIFVLIKLFS